MNERAQYPADGQLCHSLPKKDTAKRPKFLISNLSSLGLEHPKIFFLVQRHADSRDFSFFYGRCFAQRIFPEIVWLKGKDALKWYYDDAVKRSTGKLEDFRLVATWAHLDSEPMMETLAKLRREACKQAETVARSATVAGQGSRRKKAPLKEKRDTQMEVDVAARALLGMS